MSRFDAWAEGPYSMEAVATVVPYGGGKVFVQLRTNADHIMDQIVLGSRIGDDEQETLEALMAENGVCEIVKRPTWHAGKVITIPFREQVAREKKRRGLIAAIADCSAELARLQAELAKHHDEV